MSQHYDMSDLFKYIVVNSVSMASQLHHFFKDIDTYIYIYNVNAEGLTLAFCVYIYSVTTL